MTTKDFCIKWLAYTLALGLVWVVEAYFLSAIPLFGVKPMLLPLCAVAVAVLEGASGGAGFGLAVGLLFDATTPGIPGVTILLMVLLGLGLGLLAQYVLRQDLVGCFICSALALAALGLFIGCTPFPIERLRGLLGSVLGAAAGLAALAGIVFQM